MTTHLLILAGVAVFGVLPVVIACRGRGPHTLIAFGFSLFSLTPWLMKMDGTHSILTVVCFGIAALGSAIASIRARKTSDATG